MLALEGKELHDEFHEIGGFHTGVAVGADFFFISQKSCLGLHAGFRMEDRFQVGKGADAVVLAIGSDEGAVETYVAALGGRDEFELSSGEVFFFDAVGFLQHVHENFLRLQIFFGIGAGDGLQLFTGDAVGQGLLHLVLGHMDQKVGHVENRVVVIEAHIDFYFLAIFGVYHADQSQRDAGPLVFLDAAVVVGAEIHDAFLLMDRVCFEVQTRGVDVGAYDLDACMHRFFADNGQDHRLAFLVPVHFVTGLQRVHGVYRLEAGCFCAADDFRSRQALGASGVQECFVLFAIVHDSFAFLAVHALPYRLGSAICFFHRVSLL